MKKTLAYFGCAILWSIGIAHAAPPKSIRAAFEQLMAAQCDLKKFGVSTPLEARVLRNVPYALAGQQFTSPELTALFTRDGNWYKPTATPAPLDAPTAACARALQQREAQLRRTVPMRPEVEQIFTRDPKVFVGLRANPIATWRVGNPGTAADNRWAWSAVDRSACGGDGSAAQIGDCAAVQIVCELPDDTTDLSRLECSVSWAG